MSAEGEDKSILEEFVDNSDSRCSDDSDQWSVPSDDEDDDEDSLEEISDDYVASEEEDDSDA